jgi:hypothetical protein
MTCCLTTHCDGVQRGYGPGLELRTCKSCGNTRSFHLSPLPFVRVAECKRLILEVSARDDLDGRERARRVGMILEEMAEALRLGRFSVPEGLVAQ